jgi:hypothetical protein
VAGELRKGRATSMTIVSDVPEYMNVTTPALPSRSAVLRSPNRYRHAIPVGTGRANSGDRKANDCAVNGGHPRPHLPRGG